VTRHHLRILLRVWHRRFGIVLALLVLLVAITGILINHADDWHLAGNPVKSRAVLAWYGVEPPAILSSPAGDHWLSQVAGARLYFDARETTYCTGDFHGALATASGLLAACGNELVLLTDAGELVDRLGSLYQLPTPVEAIGICNQAPCLASSGKFYGIDLETPAWTLMSPSTFKASAPTRPPAELLAQLGTQTQATAIDWERFLLDLHSGRLFGLGPWLMDILAAGLILIAVSGLFIWWLGAKPAAEIKVHQRKAARRAPVADR